MDGGFVAMAFSFCAAMGADEGQQIVELGSIQDDKCIVRMIIGDSHGQTAEINKHEIGVEMLKGGAVVHIDDLQFVIVITTPA